MFEKRIYFSFDQIVSIYLSSDSRSPSCVFLHFPACCVSRGQTAGNTLNWLKCGSSRVHQAVQDHGQRIPSSTA